MNYAVNEFKGRFPEFDNTDQALLVRVIIEAQAELNPSAWRQLYDPGWMYLAADKLAMSPMGEAVRLDATSNKTTYRLEFERLCRCVAMGARVA